MLRLLTLFLLLCNTAYSGSFDIIPLGIYGGVADGNLSAYLLKSSESKNYVSLDAGTLVNGLEIASDKKSLPITIEILLQKHIPAYLISHAHLDHLIGLLMVQPDLRAQQTIMARDETLDALKKNVFNWSVWGNFGDEGDIPHLNYQHYQTMPLMQWLDIAQTSMQVKVFPLSHGTMASSAFLIRNKEDYILYFGDTGADSIEKSTYMEQIWKEVAPLIKEKRLHAIILECSFLNSQPDDKLFGHLKPRLFMQELRRLASLVNPNDLKNSLKGLPVLVTHIKPKLSDFTQAKESTELLVMNELEQENDIGVKLIRPEQGKKLIL